MILQPWLKLNEKYVLLYKLHSLKILQNLKFGFDKNGNQPVLCFEKQNSFECGNRLDCVGFED
jgi:hypothetical protein